MSRTVLQIMESYQTARTAFVQSIAEQAQRPKNIEALHNAGVLSLLGPLLLDTVPSIQQAAALAIGRMASYSEQLADAVVANEVLPQLVFSLGQQNRFFKKTAAFVLKSVAKHSPELAKSVVNAGALDSLVACLLEFEPSVKESAAWALGYIARHTPDMAQAVVDAGAVPHLVLCLQEPELSLKRVTASTLAEIAKHTPELAQIVVDAGAVSFLAPMIQHADGKLKRQVCSALSQIAKHSVDMAEVIVEAEVFPKIFAVLKDSDVVARKHAATCIREVAKHTPELSQLIVNGGGHGALIDYINEARSSSRLPGVMALGYIAAFSETLSLAIVVAQGIIPLKDALVTEPEDHIRAAAAWSLGQIGRHSPDHARALAQADVLRCLSDVVANPQSSEDLKTKAVRALKGVIAKCTHLPALEPLLLNSPEPVQRLVVEQFAKVLPNTPAARKSFVQCRGLQKLQELESNPSFYKELREHFDAIKSCFPQDVVQYYSPNYSDTLLKKLDEFGGRPV